MEMKGIRGLFIRNKIACYTIEIAILDQLDSVLEIFNENMVCGFKVAY